MRSWEGAERRTCRHCLFPIFWQTWVWNGEKHARWAHEFHLGRNCAWRGTLAEPM